jgi:hypothetical protein
MKKIIIFITIGMMISIGQAQMKKGIGPMLGTRGVGIIFSGQWQIKSNIITGFETRFYDIKNDSELPGYNRFTGQTLNVGDKALFMVPIFGTVRWLLFEGKIANNFSPFMEMKLGPILAVDGIEDTRKFSNRWGKAGTIMTYGIQVAFGVAFLQMGGSTISPSIGYEYLPMGKEVDGRTNYNGTVVNIAFTFGNNRR